MKYVLVNKLDEIVTKVELEKTSTISEAITYFQGIKKWLIRLNLINYGK